MAHFAQLDPEGVVLQVIVVGNDDTSDGDGTEIEYIGVGFCRSLLGDDTEWKQTSRSGRIRKNFASAGYVYDAGRDAFIAPRPEGEGWSMDEETCRWVNPDALTLPGI